MATTGIPVGSDDIEVRPAPARADAEIARDTVQELHSYSSLPADRLNVTVTDGWVRLEGAVDRQYQKTLAESAVGKLRGVVGVTNNIAVNRGITPGEVKSKIEAALRRSAELDARRISVEVTGGAVRLDGIVRSYAEKQEAERAARSAPGTATVENHIKIAP